MPRAVAQADLWVLTLIKDWIAKANQEAKAGSQVVGLIPARTDTLWWHNHVAALADVVFLKGRLAFGDGKNAAPFPSAIVFWNFCPTIAKNIADATGGHVVHYERHEEEGRLDKESSHLMD